MTPMATTTNASPSQHKNLRYTPGDKSDLLFIQDFGGNRANGPNSKGGSKILYDSLKNSMGPRHI